MLEPSRATARQIRMWAQPIVIVLASGRGERFRASGGRQDKLDAPLAGRTVLEHTMLAVERSGLPWHLERGPHAGMGDTIAAAVAATPHAAGWLILPGDLPLIRAETLRGVARAIERPQRGIVVPRCGQVRGHPVGFSASFGRQLSMLRGDRGASSIVQAAGAMATLLQVSDEGIFRDIDTVEDLRLAEARLAQRPVAERDAEGDKFCQ